MSSSGTATSAAAGALQQVAAFVEVLDALPFLVLGRVQEVRAGDAQQRHAQQPQLGEVARHRRSGLDGQAGVDEPGADREQVAARQLRAATGCPRPAEITSAVSVKPSTATTAVMPTTIAHERRSSRLRVGSSSERSQSATSASMACSARLKTTLMGGVPPDQPERHDRARHARRDQRRGAGEVQARARAAARSARRRWRCGGSARTRAMPRRRRTARPAGPRAAGRQARPASGWPTVVT